jgi:hypothetical protein
MMKNLQKIIVDCYEGYLALEKPARPFEIQEWVKLPEARQFIKRAVKVHNANVKAGRIEGPAIVGI